jgi:beta-lactamase class A
MSHGLDRRMVLAGLMASALPGVLRAGGPSGGLDGQIAAIESEAGGRLGIAVMDEAGRTLMTYRAEERFPMCSTFKVLAAAAVLAKVDMGRLALQDRVSYGEADLLGHAPDTRAHVEQGWMSLGDLCAAAIRSSDNTAGNLVLRTIGGPQAVTAFARSLGDRVTRLDRTEPSLNSAIPGDPRDTTTPAAMAGDLRRLFAGGALSPPSALQLEAWMIASTTGAMKLRAGLPKDWGIGDKTGAGENGVSNTIAVLRPPGRVALFAAVYLAEAAVPVEGRDRVHRQVAELIAANV